MWRSAELVVDVPAESADNDSRLIAAAAATGADLFVTGDKQVLERTQIGHMRIVSPRDAWLILYPPTDPH